MTQKILLMKEKCATRRLWYWLLIEYALDNVHFKIKLIRATGGNAPQNLQNVEHMGLYEYTVIATNFRLSLTSLG